jgi:hypothetical protein
MSRKLDIWFYAAVGTATMIGLCAGYGYFTFITNPGQSLIWKAIILIPTAFVALTAWFATCDFYDVFEVDTEEDEGSGFKAKVNKAKGVNI